MSEFTGKDYLELQPYAQLDETEFGIGTHKLLDLWEHYRSALSDELIAVIENELSENLVWYKKNTLITKRTGTRIDEWYELEQVDEEE